jgi:hypothetical protein
MPECMVQHTTSRCSTILVSVPASNCGGGSTLFDFSNPEGKMRSRLANRIIAAIASTIVFELTDLALDKVGISEERSQVPRAILKASIAAASGALIAAALEGFEKEDTDI